jgi:hypothetical protein
MSEELSSNSSRASFALMLHLEWHRSSRATPETQVSSISTSDKITIAMNQVHAPILSLGLRIRVYNTQLTTRCDNSSCPNRPATLRADADVDDGDALKTDLNTELTISI